MFIGRSDLEPLHPDQGGQLVQIIAAGIGEHYGSACLVHALAQQHLAIGGDLQDLHRRIAFGQGVKACPARLQIGEHRREDAFIVERFDHVRRGQA